MFANQPLQNWSTPYWEHVSRNIGIISFQEQDLIRTTKVAVLGVGGIGGSVAENLVRAGCQNIVIVDKDMFDTTNLNRQLCTLEDIGRYKVDVVEEFLLKIDSEINISKFISIDPDNIGIILEGVDVVALTLDGPVTSILIARECRKRNIPMAESWAVPILFCWFFTSNSIDYETLYDLSTTHLSNQDLYAQQDQLRLTSYNALVPKIFAMFDLHEKYDREPGVYEMMMQGKIGLRSFAPIVRLTADYIALEIIFAGILKIKPMILAPDYNEIIYF